MSEIPNEARDPGASASRSSRIATVRLDPFRSHRSLTLELGRRTTAVVGPNGSGKTNLVEAVSMLGPGRGVRRSQLSDMIPVGGTGFRVDASLDDGTTVGTVARISQHGPVRRTMTTNGRARAQDDAGPSLCFLWSTPETERVFTQTKVERRAFLDRLVLSVNPDHAPHHLEMDRILRHRSALLEERRVGRALDEVDVALAGAFARVHSARARVVDALNRGASALPERSFPTSDLTVSSGWPEAPVGDVETYALDVLRKRRHAHLASGRTTEGPHRADLEAVIRGTTTSARDASTGQQKAIVLSIVMSQASQVSDATPVVILDEAFSHLDPSRRDALVETIAEIDCQAILTGTDAAQFADVSYRVDMDALCQSDANDCIRGIERGADA